MRDARNEEFYTPSGVRLRRYSAGEGLDWLLLPGGPGLGSESLLGLAKAVEVPGNLWMVDLPGDGSNRDAPGAPADPYALWPDVLVEAAQAVAFPVLVAHSTGGMYALSVSGLEPLLCGFVLIESAPHAGWREKFGEFAAKNTSPQIRAAEQRYASNPSDETVRELTLATATWNVGAQSLPAAATMLERLPFNNAAVEWSGAHFDDVYEATWWPAALPTLIISGTADHVIDQTIWVDPSYAGLHIHRTLIDGGSHFPWLDRPEVVAAAINAFAMTLVARR
ncbi:alpha/beta fold hydrolase [Rathayibacter soli]|uniref:alpha/beta fold hydrolase n=1 Tax=Rathayibacter soli TaxID=3144168 RepID=UPI0027E554FC|nr:alpha/beta hydrolase [Glaciibacter superstes]